MLPNKRKDVNHRRNEVPSKGRMSRKAFSGGKLRKRFSKDVRRGGDSSFGEPVGTTGGVGSDHSKGGNRLGKFKKSFPGREDFSNKVRPRKVLPTPVGNSKISFSGDQVTSAEDGEKSNEIGKTSYVVKSKKLNKVFAGPGGNKIIKFNNGADFAKEDELTPRKWYDMVPADPEDFKVMKAADVLQLKQEAKNLLENDTLHYRNVCSKGPTHSENNWLWTMWRKGTSQDHIAAGVLIVQNSPIHGLTILRSLVGLVKPGRKECPKAMDILSDLFLSDLLIPTRKLKAFERRPLSILNEITAGMPLKRKMYLMTWFFEDQLKEEYNNFIRNIICVASERVENTKEKAVGIMRKLVAGNPEQEALLLSSIVNKLGDPSQKVASKVIFNLSKLLYEHPNMKTVVMEEIEKFLFRNNVKPRAQYYAFCLLTQLLLSNEDAELAVKLIRLYFAFFKSCLKKGEVDSRILSILLTGVNRAYPYAKKDMLQVADHIEVLYKVVHVAHIGVSLHALYLLYQVADFDAGVSDRFYSALYRKLLDPELSKSSHHALFLSLVYKAISKDVQNSRMKAFIKRLLQLCHYVPVPLACGILVTVSEILKNNKQLFLSALSTFATNFESKDGNDSEEEEYADIKLEQEEEKSEDAISPDEKPEGTEECAEDTKQIAVSEDRKNSAPEKTATVSSWYHCSITKKSQPVDSYDGYARNPLLAGQEVLVYTELVSLVTHFHPTVSLFASRLLSGEQIEYSGDPLNDFTVAKFLERFVFKNPKKIEKQVEEKPFSKLSRKYSYTPKGLRGVPVKSDQYVNADEASVPVEEQFMHRYLKGKKWKKDEKGDDSDVSSVADDEFDQVVDQLISGKEEIDFSGGIGKIPVTKKERKKQMERGGDSETDDDDEDLSGEENGDESDIDLSEDDEAEDIIFDDGEDEEKFKFSMSDLENEDNDSVDSDGEEDDFSDNDSENEVFVGKKKKGKGKGKDGVDKSVFASAEEFAQMLEDTGNFHAKHRSLAQLSNRENAAVKQLKWEQSRNQWPPHHSSKRKGHGKSGYKSSKKFKRK